MPLQTYLELHVKNAVTEALSVHRDVMRDQFAKIAEGSAGVLAAVNEAKVQNAADHATTSTTLSHITTQLQGLEPRVIHLEDRETTRTARELSREKARDWSLRIMLALVAVGGLAVAFLH